MLENKSKKINKKPIQKGKKPQNSQISQKSNKNTKIQNKNTKKKPTQKPSINKKKQNTKKQSQNLEEEELEENSNNDIDNQIQDQEDLENTQNNEEVQENNEENQEKENKEIDQELDQEQQERILQEKLLTKTIESKINIAPIYTGGKICVSTDEKHLFSCCNLCVSKFDFESRKVVDTIEHKDEEIANFAVHPSDKYIATFTKNFLVRLVNLESKQVIQTWKIQDHFAIDMQFDPSGKFLAIGCVNGQIKIFDCKSGSQTHSYRVHKGSVTKLVFHPHKSKYQLASTGDDNSIRIYDLLISQLVVSLNGHKSQITSLIYSETGTNIISGGEKIIIWDLVNYKEQGTIKYEEDIECLNYFSCKYRGNTRNYLVVAGTSGVFKTIDITDGEVEVKSFKQYKTHEILKIMVMKQNKQLCMITQEQNIFLYNYLCNDTTNNEVDLIINDSIIGFNDEITDAKFRKCKKGSMKPFQLENEYVMLASNSSMLRAISLSDNKCQLLTGHTDIILCLDIIDDYIISGGKDKTICLWKYIGNNQELKNQAKIQKVKNHFSEDFILIAQYTGHTEAVNSLNFSPKFGRFFASASTDQNVKIWDLSQLISETAGFDKEGNYKIQKIKNSLQSVFAHQKDINAVKISPNEKFCASASQDRSIKIWKTENLGLHLTLKGHKRGVWDIAFSPIEQVLASACGDQTIKLWNLIDGQCMQTLEGHLGSVIKVQWISQGLQLLSAGQDSLVKIWNIKKETCVNTFENHDGKIWALDVSVNDKYGKQYFLSGGNDSELFIYQDTTKEVLDKKKVEEHDKIIQQQEYQSFIREKDYISAAKLAFKQNFTSHFYKSLEMLFSQLDFQNSLIFSDFEMKVKPNEEFQEQQRGKVEEMVQFFIDKDLSRLLVFIRDMNTSYKNSKISQILLSYVFKLVNIDELMEMKKKFKIQNRKSKEFEKADFDKLLQTLEMYSAKHLERCERFVKKTYFLDFVIKKIDAIAITDN